MKDQHTHPEDWDTLSMGMSSDLEAAIAAGSTMVRGTALFGQYCCFCRCQKLFDKVKDQHTTRRLGYFK